MRETFYAAVLGLPIWWLAQALLSLRDYFRQREEIRRMPAPTAEELQIIARIQAERPPKEKKSLRWYLQNPGHSLKFGGWLVPVLILFWPMAVMMWTLPPLETRFSPEILQRLRAEGS